jgi:HAMP domain-containing protein
MTERPAGRGASIANRISLAFLGISAFAFLSIGVALVSVSADGERRLLEATVVLNARKAAASLALSVEEKTGALELAARMAAAGPFDRQGFRNAMALAFGSRQEFRQIAAYGGGGERAALLTLLPSTDARLLPASLPIDERPGGAGAEIGRTYFDPQNGEAEGGDGAYVMAELCLCFARALVRDVRPGATGYAYAIDGEGWVIASSDRIAGLYGKAAPPEIASRSDTGDSALRYAGFSSQEVIGATAAVPRSDWRVVAEIPYAELSGPLTAAFSYAALALGLCIDSGILGLALSKRLSAPIVALSRTAKRIEEGGGGERAAECGIRELDDLARSFNRLMSSLESRLEALSRARQELATTNEELERSLEQREGLLKELHHRVKNNLQVISSMIDMQGDSAPPEAASALLAARQRVRAIAMIHELLYL